MLNELLGWWGRRKADKVRTVPDEYFLDGYRRLAPTASAVIGQKCWNCRHEVGYRTWWCDRADKPCKWERCYVADELTKADLRAGRKLVGGWIGLPDRVPNASGEPGHD